MRKKILLAISVTLGCLLALVFCFAFLIKLTFGGMWENTVVEKIPSPGGNYYAEVIDSNQGAMGGNTFVDVREQGLFKESVRIYTGVYGEFNSMEIYWKGENCLVINGVEYDIPE